MSDFTTRVYDLVRCVPHGTVVSYGGIAALLGQPRAARGVGHALHALPDGSDVPWWRVVNRNGEISIRGTPHGARLQRELLRAEGVRFDRRGRIDWQRFGWTGPHEAADEPANVLPFKRSCALLIRRPADRNLVLLVLRPDDDEDLAAVWGLPAASLTGAESWHDAARRAARDKLGCSIRLGALLAEGCLDRSAYRLTLRLFRASLHRARSPDLHHNPDHGRTRYQAWRWAPLADLQPAADRGSLCARLALQVEGIPPSRP